MNDIRQTTQCQGKHAFATKSSAIEMIERRRKASRWRYQGHKEKRRELAALSAYRCPFCHHWHIGGHNA